MKIEKIYLNTEDNLELMGLLHRPENKTNEVLITVHGITSNFFKKRDDILASYFTQKDIAYFTFNNRGSEVINKMTRRNENSIKREFIGSAFEDVLDSYYDVKSAIEKMIELGYTKIYLQGHSLGCLKVVYSYNKLKEKKDRVINNIEAVFLLSMVDIYDFSKRSVPDFDYYYNMAIEKEKNGDLEYILPNNSFISLVSVRTYLRYFKYNMEINFPRYSDEKYDFKEINDIDVPVFMRWGNINECIVQNVEELVKQVNSKVNNSKKNIGYIDGANHGYNDREEILANEELEFIKLIR